MSGWSRSLLEGVLCFTSRHELRIYNVLLLLTVLTESEIRIRNFKMKFIFLRGTIRLN